MSETIKLYMEDWLYTSGIVGLYNILNLSGDKPLVRDNYLEIKSEDLENFEEKYFKYFIKRYEDIFSLFKIKKFKDFLDYHEEDEFEDFDEKSLEILNKYISDTLKRQLKSNSYKSAYDLIDGNLDLLNLEKNIKTIKLKKKESIKDRISEIKDTFSKIKEVIKYMESDQAIKYIGGKNAMYSIIKNAWNGICFLNPQTKEKDMYIDYHKHFIDPVIEYLGDDRSNYKYECFTCGSQMKDFKNDLSFVNGTGFDVTRKSSHVWDFQNDVAVCPICKLIYSCVPAGITYIYDRGIFINDNSSIQSLIDINQKIFLEIYKTNFDGKKLTTRALIQAINQEYTNKLKYELSDVQVIRYEDESYSFNLLSKNIIEIINKSKESLDLLVNTGFKEINTYFNIYELVVNRLLNGQNMFTLVQKLLYYKLSQPKDSYYNGGHILAIIRINTSFLREVGAMEKNEKDIIKQGNGAGYYLRESYRSKGAVDKLGGISYKLLNALKTNNKDSFMDTILNCYLYVKEEVPRIFLEVLRTDEDFKTIGYAFVTGLSEGKTELSKEEEK